MSIQMDEQNYSFLSGKNKLLLAALVALLFIGGLFFLVNRKGSSLRPKNSSFKQVWPMYYSVTQNNTAGLPEYFSSDFPLESGVKIDSGYNVSSPGKTQATVYFVSRYSIDENFKVYNDYLNKKNGWTVLNVYSAPTVKSISAFDEKGTSVLVNIALDTISKSDQVTISFVYNNSQLGLK